MIQKTALFLFLLLHVSCSPAVRKTANALDVTSCALRDERLQMAFKDPAAAKSWFADTGRYLKHFGNRLKDKNWTPTQRDINRFLDLQSLYERLAKCFKG